MTYYPDINEYMGKVSVQIVVTGLLPYFEEVENSGRKGVCPGDLLCGNMEASDAFLNCRIENCG